MQINNQLPIPEADLSTFEAITLIKLMGMDDRGLQDNILQQAKRGFIKYSRRSIIESITGIDIYC